MPTEEVYDGCADILPGTWEHNPNITPLADDEPGAEKIECHYPLIHQSNERPVHFLQGFIEYLSQKLGAPLKPRAFKGDIHLSANERTLPSPMVDATGEAKAYWLIVAGGKMDYTIKWWSSSRFQAVVDSLKDSIHFVQVGAAEHFHPPLNGVLDMRGKTSIRELIRWVYHSEGVLCPVTFLMHLAAAVPLRPGKRSRPCVVVAGGREPPHWEAYPTHQFIHTVGALDCCRTGGCWRSRTVPLGDGDTKDRPKSLCVDVVESLPRCMHLITPASVVERIRLHHL